MRRGGWEEEENEEEEDRGSRGLLRSAGLVFHRTAVAT